jgi:AcrR family transcriptional regulator
LEKKAARTRDLAAVINYFARKGYLNGTITPVVNVTVSGYANG